MFGPVDIYRPSAEHAILRANIHCDQPYSQTKALKMAVTTHTRPLCIQTVTMNFGVDFVDDVDHDLITRENRATDYCATDLRTHHGDRGDHSGSSAHSTTMILPI